MCHSAPASGWGVGMVHWLIDSVCHSAPSSWWSIGLKIDIDREWG